MRRSAILPTAIIAFLLLSCGGGNNGGGNTPPPPPPQGATFTPEATPSAPRIIVNGPSSRQVGTITIDVYADSISAPTYGVAFDMDFDPTIVTFNGSQQGVFLDKGFQPQLSYQAATATGAQPNPGKLIVSATRLGNIGGVTGSGTIISLTFNILNKGGQTSLAFSNNNLLDVNGQPLPGINWSAGKITVQ